MSFTQNWRRSSDRHPRVEVRGPRPSQRSPPPGLSLVGAGSTSVRIGSQPFAFLRIAAISIGSGSSCVDVTPRRYRIGRRVRQRDGEWTIRAHWYGGVSPCRIATAHQLQGNPAGHVHGSPPDDHDRLRAARQRRGHGSQLLCLCRAADVHRAQPHQARRDDGQHQFRVAIDLHGSTSLLGSDPNLSPTPEIGV